MPPVFTFHFVQYLRYNCGSLSVYRVKVKTLKAHVTWVIWNVSWRWYRNSEKFIWWNVFIPVNYFAASLSLYVEQGCIIAW